MASGPLHANTNLTSLRSLLAMQHYARRLFNHISSTVYIGQVQLSEPGENKNSQTFKWYQREDSNLGSLNKAVRQRSDLLFIETSFWFQESPCAVRTNTAGLGRLCTLFVLSTLLVFEHLHAVLSSILVLCCTMVTTKHCCYE